MAAPPSAAVSADFGHVEAGQLARLVDDHPLAWIVSRTAPALASPMPMLLERGAAGQPQALLGHLPKAHPLASAFARDPAGVFLFQGPHAYISPQFLDDRDWAPTWNFAVAVVEADVVLDDALTDEALNRLVAHMEHGRPQPWTTTEMGERYGRLRSRVIGFRAKITACRARFKLGQDESDTAFGEILAGLGDTPLARMMAGVRGAGAF